MKRILTFFALLFACVLTNAQTRDYVYRQFEAQNGQRLPYAILYPENFDPAKTYPLLVFLHGSGERGTDGKAQLVHGSSIFASAEELKEVIFIAPQCPIEDSWVLRADSRDSGYAMPYSAPISYSLTAVKELLDSYIALGFADKDRMFACGLSLGAMGILDFTMRYPDYFVAIQPICGSVNAQRCAEFRGKTRFRFFHGTNDTVVLPEHSKNADAALQNAGVSSQIVLYPGLTHNSWDKAFSEPDFFTWMLGK